MIIERTQAAAVNDLSRPVNDVDSLWPRSVGVIGRVIHRVDGDGNWKMEARHKIVGDGYSLGERGGLRVANVLGDVRLHLPFVLRMRFADVDSQKIGAVFVLVVNLDEISNLAAERRSSIAPEN